MQHNYKQAAYRGTNMDSTYALLGKYMETNRAHYTSVFSTYVLFSISLVVLLLLFLLLFVESDLTYSVSNCFGVFLMFCFFLNRD